MKGGYIFPVPIAEIFWVFYWHKTLIIQFQEKIQKNQNAETPPKDQHTLAINPTTLASGPTAHFVYF